MAREQSWGSYTKPADYLDSFTAFVRQQLNQSAALSVVVNRPKDLTRAQLKEVRLLLDGAGYTEAGLKAAWRGKTNQDIAAGIMAYIRQAAAGAGTGVAGELERLADLRDNGVITDAEFENRKAKLLQD